MAKLFTEKLEKIHKDIFKDHRNALLKLVGKSHGVYALYKRDRLYYVGKASDLKKRVGEHLNDIHARKWTHFTAFLTSKSEDIKDIEAVLIIIADPDGNTNKPKSSAKDMLKSLEALIKEEQEEKRRKILGKKSTSKKKKDVSKKKKSKAIRKQSTLNSETGKNKLVKMKQLFDADLIKEGDTWYFKNNKKNIEGIITSDGQLKVGGKTYTSHHKAGKEAMNWPSCNGWNHWQYRDEQGELQLIDDFRQEYVKMKSEDR